MRRARRIVRGRFRAATAATLVALAAAQAQALPSARQSGPPDVAAARAERVAIYPQLLAGRPRRTAALAGGYTPAQIRAAYFVKPLLRAGIMGKGQSIVIVDSFGSPTITADLAAFDNAFKLRSPRALTIIHPAGQIPEFRPTGMRIAWAEETTLDVEWAHVMAPAARIVLVETPVSENEGTSGFPQIMAAERYAIGHRLGGVISQSFGATEETFPKGTLRPLRAAYIEAARRANDVTVVSASGDAGATDYTSTMHAYFAFPVTSWPASDPLVTSVGGLDLSLRRSGARRAPDRVWNDKDQGGPSAGGGGLSVMFGRPAFQDGVAAVVGGRRGVPDISMSASCSHPVVIYARFAGGWLPICGTSEATPLFAGIVALADQVAGRPLGPINAYLYQLAAAKKPGIADITRGDNTVSFTQHGSAVSVTGWPAEPGYDLASGLGTVDARLFVPELAALASRAGAGKGRR